MATLNLPRVCVNMYGLTYVISCHLKGCSRREAIPSVSGDATEVFQGEVVQVFQERSHSSVPGEKPFRCSRMEAAQVFQEWSHCVIIVDKVFLARFSYCNEYSEYNEVGKCFFTYALMFQGRSHSNVTFVGGVLQQRVPWINTV